MLQAAKEQSCPDAVLFGDALPLAAGGVPENSPQGYSSKNRASHLGRSFTNSTSALGIELTVRWEGVGSVDSARYYDPSVGRFLSEDPIGLNGGINVYRYVLNSPTDYFDPLGLKARKCSLQKCNAAFPSDPTNVEFAQLVYAEGNGTPVGDLAVSSVVVNRANYGNPGEFGIGILGVISKPHQFQAYKNTLFNSVGTLAQVAKLNPADCLRYKNAVNAAKAAQAPEGTNTDAEFYYDVSQGMPSYINQGLQNGTMIPAPVDGGPNWLEGTYGGKQYFFQYTDYSH